MTRCKVKLFNLEKPQHLQVNRAFLLDGALLRFLVVILHHQDDGGGGHERSRQQKKNPFIDSDRHSFKKERLVTRPWLNFRFQHLPKNNYPKTRVPLFGTQCITTVSTDKCKVGRKNIKKY